MNTANPTRDSSLDTGGNPKVPLIVEQPIHTKEEEEAENTSDYGRLFLYGGWFLGT